MRDIRGDLQDRASFLEEQITVVQAQFEKHMEQVTLEHQVRIDDLRAELEAVTTLMEGEYRRLTDDAGAEERRAPAPQPVQEAEPQRRPAPQARAEPEIPHRLEPEPRRGPVAAKAEPARVQSPGRDERYGRQSAEPAYRPRPQPAQPVGETDPYRRPAVTEAPERRPVPAAETGAQHRPNSVEEAEQERRSAAPQIYSRAPLAQDRGRQPAPAAAQPQVSHAQTHQQPQQRAQGPQRQQPPLADFLIRKMSEGGAMGLEDLCHLAVRDGYFAEGENPERSVQVTLMNVVTAGFIRQLPNGTFAPATVMDTIRLRRAI